MKLNDTSLKWNDVVPIIEKRCFGGSAVFCNNLVVAGGENDKDILESIEYFSGSLGEWQMGPPMQRKRKEFCLVECDDSLFAFGRNNEVECLSSVEQLRSMVDGSLWHRC